MYHLDHHVLLKLVVVITTAVVIVYLSAIGAIDLTASSSTQTAQTPTEAGQALVEEGKYTEAIALYQEQLTSLDTALAEANLNLAQTYQANQQPADAEAIYRRVLRLTTELKAAYVGLAEVLLDQKRNPEAAAVILQGMTAFPADTELLQLDDQASHGTGA